MNTGHLDGAGLAELRGYNFQNLPSAPTTNLYEGRFYYNSSDHTLYVYNGTEWVNALTQGQTYLEGAGIDITSNTISIDLATGANAGNVTLTTTNGLAASVTEASTSAKGIIEIATDSEAGTGTSESLAVNPKQLATKIGLTDLSIDSGSTNYLGYDNTTGKFSAKVDTTVTANSSKLVTSGAVNTAINNAISGGMVYKGVWTATGQTDYSSITLPVKAGYMYLVSGSATIGGIEWNTDDYLVINADVAAGGTITDVKKIDNTEGSDIVRLNASQTLTNKTIDADDNTISDLTVSNFKSGTITTSVGATGSDSAIPTEKAVRSAISALSYSITNDALTQSGGVCTWTVTHNLNNSNVQVNVYEVSTGDRVMYDYSITSANVVTVKILSASNISAGTYKVVVQG